MASGGARARSGPPPSPTSGASDRKGLKFSPLPANGYDGEIPAFPRPVLHGSELSHWEAVWRTPQASLWATPQWSFVIPTVALYCSLLAWSELEEYPVGILAQIRGLAGEILLTPDALARSGFVIPADELADRRESKSARASSRDRLKVAGDGR